MNFKRLSRRPTLELVPAAVGDANLVGRRKRDDDRVRRYLPVPVVSRSTLDALIGACLAEGCDLVIFARPSQRG